MENEDDVRLSEAEEAELLKELVLVLTTFSRMQYEIDLLARKMLVGKAPELEKPFKRFLNSMNDDERRRLVLSVAAAQGDIFDADSFSRAWGEAKARRDEIAHHAAFTSHQGLFVRAHHQQEAGFATLQQVREAGDRMLWLSNCVTTLHLRIFGTEHPLPGMEEWNRLAVPDPYSFEEYAQNIKLTGSRLVGVRSTSSVDHMEVLKQNRHLFIPPLEFPDDEE